MNSEVSVGDTVTAYLPTHSRWKRATVVDTRVSRRDDDHGSFEYYVHYQQMNRRHDRWISFAEIRLIEEGEEDRAVKRHHSDEVKEEDDEEDDDEDDDDEEEDEEEEEAASELEYSDVSDHEGMNETDIIEWEKATKVKRIDRILLGGSVMETWYWSPFPPEFQDCSLLYMCEFCLSFFREKSEFQGHASVCKFRHPPGDEIYSDPETKMSVFEVDGFFERVYAENLCYLSKLFLDHKRFDRFDVSNFYFYIVGQWIDNSGFRLIGYFSKEKQSTNRNLSCIMSLPCFQRKGYGSFIIEFSYEISKIAKKMGTPERPLSDLGKRTYLRWWLQRILRILKDCNEPITISDLSKLTFILPEDIKATLEEYKLLYYFKGAYHIALPPDRLESLWLDDNPNHVRVNPVYIHWTPLELPDPNIEPISF